MITFEELEVKNPLRDARLIKIWLTELIEGKDYEIGEIVYYFCNDTKILEANREFLTHDYFTDVITFDTSVGKVLSADILISLETVASNSKKYEEDFGTELHRVMAHAILHLLGFNDKEEQEKIEMREAENAALLKLKKMKNYV